MVNLAFKTETYKSRREELRKTVSHGLLVFPGNTESSRNFVDNLYPFRQDSAFLYYAGLNEPGLALIMDCESGKDILFGEDISIDQVIWEGDRPSMQEKKEACGVDEIKPLSSLINFLKEAIGKGIKLHFLPPYREGHYLFWNQVYGREEEIDQLASEELVKASAAQREIKSTEELEEMMLASTITGQMHMAAMKTAKPGMREYQVKAVAVGEVEKSGGALSFTPIITRSGHILHNHSYSSVIQEGDLLLVDCGAETKNCYAGDRTSTFPVSGTFNDTQKVVYEAVLSAFDNALENIKEGVTFKEVHLSACRELVNGLLDLGIFSGKAEDIVESGAHALVMPHGLGHMIGLDVHDMENYGETLIGYDHPSDRSTAFGLKSLRLGKKLKTGMALTVEPGCYFIPKLIEKWKSENKFVEYINYSKLKDFYDFGGIRIEDDYLVEADGIRLLGTSLPRKVSEIEEIRRAAF